MTLAKWLIYIGIGFVSVGLVIFLLAKLGIPFGKLPGNLKGEKYGVYFPIVTSIVVSAILTILLNLFFWLFRK